MHMYRCCWGSVHHFLCTCMYICVCMGLHMCVHCQGRGSVPTALKPLTLAQPGSSLEGSRTGSHRGCWHSCSYRVPPARHTHPHPGSHPRFGQSQSQRDRRSGSHLAYCGRRRCRRPPATGHIHSRLSGAGERDDMGGGAPAFALALLLPHTWQLWLLFQSPRPMSKPPSTSHEPCSPVILQSISLNVPEILNCGVV